MQRPEAPDVHVEKAQPVAEQDDADQNPDAAADAAGAGPRLPRVDEADRDQRQRPELQILARPQDVQVVEREQRADDGDRDAEDELTGDPKS